MFGKKFLLLAAPIGLITFHAAFAVAPKSTFAAAAPSKKPAGIEHTAEVKRLISLAKENGERELNVAWCQCSLGGAEGAKRLETLFNGLYGLNIRVTFTPAVSMTEMAGRITQEVVAGQKASSDLLLGSETHYGALLDRGVLEEYDYTRLSPRITADLVAPKNIAVQIAGSGIAGIAYNTSAISSAEIPKKLEDVLNPKWKGKIASSVNAAYLDRVAYRPEWGPEKMKVFVKKLSGHIGGLIVTGEMSRIVSGEFTMLVLGGHTQVLRDKAKGAPLDFIIPDDAAIVGFLHLGVPRNSVHSNLAKLFISMITSEEGQRIIYEGEFTDHPLLPGSRSAALLKDLNARGIEPLKFGVKFVSENPEIRQLGDQLRNILRQK